MFLDEPTNDLDIQTLIALEEYLDDFAGALIVVSHDRYFLDRTVDDIFRFEGEGEINEYPGNYSAYLERKEAEVAVIKEAEKQVAIEPKETVSQTQNNAPKKLSYKETREFEKLETDIAEAEDRLTEIETQLIEFATDSFKLNELYTEKQTLEEKLEIDVERWAELAERSGL